MRSAHAVVLCALALSVTVAAIPMRVDIENVPVDRVVANLERDVAAEPNNAGLRVNLARVHAIVYAQKLSAVPSGSYPGGKTPPRVPWTGDFIPDFQQFDVKPATEPAAISAARDHLAKAIARYREALEIEPTNLVARIGLGWTLSESGDKAGAIAALRDVVARSTPQDLKRTNVMMGIRSLTEEATKYLVPLLDPVKDREEIARLQATAGELARQPRPITPIAIPLQDGLSAIDITDEDASVAFDLDGSALPQRWRWIRPNAAWLVFDRRGTGSITSGLQLFGSVTFWLFWENGTTRCARSTIMAMARSPVPSW